MADRALIAVALAFGLAAALDGTAARAAASTTVVLDYQLAANAPGCPDAREFRVRVARQLGHDPFQSDAERRVSVQITRKEQGFEGDVTWTDATGAWTGDRHLSSRRAECTDIANSLAFLVAVQVQLLETLNRLPAAAPAAPVAVQAPPPPPATPEPPASDDTSIERPATVPEADAMVRTVAAPPPEASPPFRLSVGFGPALGLGLGPAPLWLARLTTAVRRGPLSLALALDGSLAAELRQDDGSGFLLRRTAGSAVLCGHLAALTACAVGAGGVLWTRGQGIDAPAHPHGWFGQAGARLGAQVDVGQRFYAAAHADALFLVAPWTIRVNGFPYWTTPRLGAILAVEIGARFF